MKLDEYVDKVNSISARIENIESDIDGSVSELRKVRRELDDLPSEVDEIELPEKEEEEEEK